MTGFCRALFLPRHNEPVYTEYLKIRFKSRNRTERDSREMQRKSGLNRCPSSINN